MTATSSILTRRSFLRNACAACATVAAANAAGGLLPLPALGACGPDRTEQEARLLMGTVVTLTAVSADAAGAREAFALAFAEMERLIAIFDRHDSGSVLGHLNAAGFVAPAPPELVAVLGQAVALGRSTGFAFNPAIAPLLELFDAARTAKIPLPGYGDSDFKHALALSEPGAVRCEGDCIRLEREGMRLTLDGIAKGYIADAASRVLSRSGLRNHMVNAGGDIRVSGRSASGRAWTVGVRHPGTAAALLSAVPVAGGGIATSGSYENYYTPSRGRHHLISHLTGKSADSISVTVRAPSAAQADALATALALMPPARAIRYVEGLSGAACLIVDRQGRRFSSGTWA